MPARPRKRVITQLSEEPVWVRNATRRAMAILWCQTNGWKVNRFGHFLSQDLKIRFNFNDPEVASFDVKRETTSEERQIDPLHHTTWEEKKSAYYKDLKVGKMAIIFPEDEEQKAAPAAEAGGPANSKE